MLKAQPKRRPSMKQIEISNQSASTQVARFWFKTSRPGIFGISDWVCRHERAEVIAPCCNGRDCGCRGSYSVFCPDPGCYISEMDAEDLIEEHIGSLEANAPEEG